MSILVWMMIGLMAGWLAKIVSPGLEPGGFIATLLIGICGAFLGGWLFSIVGHGGARGIDVVSMLVACGGAFACLATWRTVAGTRTF